MVRGEKERRRERFAEQLARTGSVKAAAELAGISERTGRRWRDGAESASRQRVASPWRLPGPTTSFVGRVAALGAVRKLFADGARLVTLLGPAGIGKTRLAARYAESYAEHYPGGVWFCDLSGARTAEAVAGAVADAIGAPLPADESDTSAQVGALLAERGEALVVLDHFEQAIAAADASVGAWFEGAARAHFLVTSRDRLRVASELVWFLEGLDVPEVGTSDRRAALGSDAVELFVDRAALVQPAYALPDDDVRSVCALVARLEGTPLAIELAAARTNGHSPAQLVERLERRFELLAGQAGDGAARPSSMRAVLDWSWDQLPPIERVALVQVAVFRRRFTLEDAEQVVDLAPAIAEGDARQPVHDVLEALTARSLLQTIEGGGAPWFGLHDSVREYALEKLDVLGLRAGAALRHARWLAERAVPGKAVRPLGPDDLDDLLVAHRFCARRTSDTETAALAGRVALAAGPRLRGRPQTARELFDQTLATDSGRIDPALRARLLVARADLARARGDVEAAVSDLAQAAALAREVRDDALGGEVLALRGRVLHGAGRIDEADECHAQALAFAQRIGDGALERRVLGHWAHTQRLRRNVSDAVRLATAALELARAHGDKGQEADMLTVLGTLQHGRGQLGLAREHFARAASVAREDADKGREAAALGHLAELDEEAGDLDAARDGVEAALAIVRSLGMRRLEGVGLGHLGAIFFEMGRLADARASYERAVTIARRAGDAVHEALFSAQLAGVLAAMDLVGEAEEQLRQADEELLPSLDADDALVRTAELQRGHLELAFARRAETAGRLAEAKALRDRVQERVEEARAEEHVGGDVVSALRVLSRALDRPSSPFAPERAQKKALVVTEDAGRARTPRGTLLDLEKRRPVRLLLKRLVDERIANPGAPLGVDDLLAAGWPGERILRDAGASRVYVALGTLRKLGLRDVLLSREGGYVLDPDVETLVVKRI